MELCDKIKVAWTAVQEANLPEQVQPVAFKEALRVTLETAQPAAGGHGRDGAGQQELDGRSASNVKTGAKDGAENEGVDEEAVRAAVADRTGVPATKLEEIFFIDDGVWKISASHSNLGRTTSEKTRAAALLISVVRKVGMQLDTPVDLIRDECQRKAFYDPTNFSRHINGVDGCVIKGDGKNKRLEPRAAAFTAFTALIDQMTGDS